MIQDYNGYFFKYKLNWQISYHMLLESVIKRKNRDTTQSNKRNNQTSKSKRRQLHDIRRQKWQHNMNLYENQGWNQVLLKGQHFTLRMRHPSEWNALMTTIAWPTDVISHGGHW